MKVITYNDPREYWQDISPYLKNEETKNNLLLGISYHLSNNSKECLYQSAIFEDNKIVGTNVCSRYRSNLVLLPSPTTDQKIVELMLSDLKKNNIAFNAVVGEKETVNIFEQLLQDQGFLTHVHMSQGIYKCRRVKMPSINNNLIFRLAINEDVKIISQWIREFQVEAVPHDPPINAEEMAISKVNEKMVYVIEKLGQVVSMAAWSRDIVTSCSVNMVYTPKEYRKQGYASHVTAHLTQKLLSSGKKEVNLYTDMLNPTSNKIYQDIGYEFVCNSIHLGISDKY